VDLRADPGGPAYDTGEFEDLSFGAVPPRRVGGTTVGLGASAGPIAAAVGPEMDSWGAK
jgi:hypothetical protein